MVRLWGMRLRGRQGQESRSEIVRGLFAGGELEDFGGGEAAGPERLSEDALDGADGFAHSSGGGDLLERGRFGGGGHGSAAFVTQSQQTGSSLKNKLETTSQWENKVREKTCQRYDLCDRR